MRFRNQLIRICGTGRPRVFPRALAFCLTLCVPGSPIVGVSAAQGRSAEDRSLSASLLAASVPGPVAPFRPAVDSAAPGRSTRFEVDYARDFGNVQPTGELNAIVLGVRSESQASDTDGNLIRGAGVLGARVGLRAGDHRASQVLSAWEVYFGGRNLITTNSLPFLDAGLELAIGWGNLGVEKRASLGFRAPIEMVHESSRARTTLFLVPGMAWGRLRSRACEDMGPGDNCGDLGFQLAAGRTRFLLAGGAGITLVPSRLSINVGVQRLFAVGEQSRVWIGSAWTY